MKLRLNLQLSCYNGARYLPSLFASLAQQTDRD
jgi:glycosyltransferase involved in cell wall biosynthesis